MIRRLEAGVHGRNKGRKRKEGRGDNDDDKKAREEGRSKRKMTKKIETLSYHCGYVRAFANNEDDSKDRERLKD